MHLRLSLSALILLVVPACGRTDTQILGVPPSEGLALYQKARCDTCHGEAGAGLPRVGPELRGIAANWTREELAAYMLDPAPFRSSKPHLKQLSSGYFAHMRPFPELAEEERLVLADWLLARP